MAKARPAKPMPQRIARKKWRDTAERLEAGVLEAKTREASKTGQEPPDPQSQAMNLTTRRRGVIDIAGVMR